MIDIVIRLIPQTGQFMVKWPDGVDEVTRMGMVEMAKASLIMEMKGAAEKPRIEVPQVKLS